MQIYARLGSNNEDASDHIDLGSSLSYDNDMYDASSCPLNSRVYSGEVVGTTCEWKNIVCTMGSCVKEDSMGNGKNVSQNKHKRAC